LRRGFTLAVRAGRLPHRPLFPTLHIANARQGFVEDADLASLLPHLPDYVQPLVRFLAFTGWRVREASGLQWSQVDFTAQTVRLHKSKNGDARTFPFGAFPALAELLREQRARTSALVGATGEAISWVFHRHGEEIRSFRHVWREACQRAGFPGLLVHDLRRSAVRSLERAGVSRSVAMSLTGHRTEAIYRRYAIVDTAAQSEGVAKLAAFHRTVTVQSEAARDAGPSGDAA
jgi:integrase